MRQQAVEIEFLQMACCLVCFSLAMLSRAFRAEHLTSHGDSEAAYTPLVVVGRDAAARCVACQVEYFRGAHRGCGNVN